MWVIEPRLLRDTPEVVRASQVARGDDPAPVDAWLSADQQWRAATAQVDSLRAEQRRTSRALGPIMARLAEAARATGADAAGATGVAPSAEPSLAAQAAVLRAEGDALATRILAAEQARNTASEAATEAMHALSNIVDPAAPVGGEADFVVRRQSGTPPDFTVRGFPPRDHVEIGRLLAAIDLERGAKVSGSRFYFLTGVGALLEFALVAMAMAKALEHGLTPVIPPVLVRPPAMAGTGFLGQAAENVYALPEDDLYLVGTSEVPLTAMHADEILDADQLPVRYAGYSSCFRREAGAHGRDTRGIFRVHWFDKVEMVSVVHPDRAVAEHERMLAIEEEMLTALELPYRVIDVATGDLGASAARKFDCEVWIPTMGAYRELTSTSNCTSFQSRRLGIRMRSADGTSPVATLNGTLMASTRTIVALLENHQQPDGSVRIPAALRAHLGGRECLHPVGG